MPIDSNALINSRETTDEEISELAQLSAEARAKLKPWLDTVAPKTALQTLGIGKGAPWRAGINGLGGAEGVSTLFKLAHMDKDGNGEIAQKELEDYLEQGQDGINRMLELCLNSGVVSALVLSFIVPALLIPPEVSQETISFFGDGTDCSLCDKFSLTFLIMMQLTFFFCSATMFYSCRIYTVLTVWSLTLESRMWFLANSPVAVNLLNSSILLISKPHQSTPAAALRGRV